MENEEKKESCVRDDIISIVEGKLKEYNATNINPGNLENLYENIESAEIKEGVRQKLIADKDNAYMSYDLATIFRDVPLEFSLEDCKYGGINKNEFVKMLEEFEFHSMLRKLEFEFGGEEKEEEQKEEEKKQREKEKREEAERKKAQRGREKIETKLINTGAQIVKRGIMKTLKW